LRVLAASHLKGLRQEDFHLWRVGHEWFRFYVRSVLASLLRRFSPKLQTPL